MIIMQRKDQSECVVQTVGTAMDISRGSCKLDTGTFLQELNQIPFIVAGAEAGLFVGRGNIYIFHRVWSVKKIWKDSVPDSLPLNWNIYDQHIRRV